MKTPVALFPAASTSRHATGDETRARLLAAATEVFLEDGFRAARVQDIAERAGLRLSAINYHFEGKEGLYLAVLRHHADLALSSEPLTPLEGGLPLRARFDFTVRALIMRMLGSQSRIGQFMLRELVSPTPALQVLIENFSAPQAGVAAALLREIVGPAVPEVALGRCLISIFGQCVIYITGRPLIERVAPQIFAAQDLQEATIRHVADFSWAGLQAVRQQWETTPSAPGAKE